MLQCGQSALWAKCRIKGQVAILQGGQCCVIKGMGQNCRLGILQGKRGGEQNAV